METMTEDDFVALARRNGMDEQRGRDAFLLVDLLVENGAARPAAERSAIRTLDAWMDWPTLTAHDMARLTAGAAL